MYMVSFFLSQQKPKHVCLLTLHCENHTVFCVYSVSIISKADNMNYQISSSSKSSSHS